MRLLVVEDEEKLAQLIKRALVAGRFSVERLKTPVKLGFGQRRIA